MMRNSKTIVLGIMLMLGASGISAQAWSGEFVLAEGDFTVGIDFPTLTLTQIDENCLLEVEGVVTFTGTLEGIASARTRALTSASCVDVASFPPGAFEDVFTSKLEFAGTIDGHPIVADFTYRGETEIGGAIEAVFIGSDGLRGRLSVDAIVAVGGSYKGLLRVPGHW